MTVSLTLLGLTSKFLLDLFKERVLSLIDLSSLRLLSSLFPVAVRLELILLLDWAMFVLGALLDEFILELDIGLAGELFLESLRSFLV